MALGTSKNLPGRLLARKDLCTPKVSQAQWHIPDIPFALTIHPLASNPSNIAFAAKTTVERYFGLG